jgi:hypothetical protein
VNFSVVLAALGQALFSLSIGMGAILTYGSYLKKEDNVLKSAYAIIISGTIFAILVGVVILMFTGNIQYEFTEECLKVDATYWQLSTVGYEFVDSVEFRENFDMGIRNYGFYSAKLSLGNFQNDEFGSYTLYAYNKCDSAVVIKSGEHILVITGQDIAETQELYNSLKTRID